jgi:hypothetical protein
MGGGEDYSQYTFDPQAHEAASQFLGQYGLSPLDPSQVKPNTILPNSGFFANHPRLSSMLEGGIYGAAATRGGATIGDNISNVADSLIAGPRMRAAAYNQQFERPFQAAHMLEGMQDQAQKRELTEAQIQHARAVTQRLNDPLPKPDHPVTGMSANDSSFFTYDSEGNATQHENPFFDKTAANAGKMHPGITAVYRYFRQMGITDPDNATPEQWKKVNQMDADDKVAIAGSRTAAEAIARIRASYRMGATVPKEVDNAVKEAGKDWWDPKNKTLRQSIRSNAIMSGQSKLLSDDEINQQINEHNRGVNEKIHSVYDDWQTKFNQQNPNSPMP